MQTNSDTLSMKTIINKLDFLKKKVIIHCNAWKKRLSLLANKLIKNIPDPCHAKDHYESFSKKKKNL